MLGNFGPDNFQAAFEALDVNESQSINRQEFERALVNVLHVEVDDLTDGALDKADVDLVFKALAGKDEKLDWSEFDSLMHGRFKRHFETARATQSAQTSQWGSVKGVARSPDRLRTSGGSSGSQGGGLAEGTEVENPLAGAGGGGAAGPDAV